MYVIHLQFEDLPLFCRAMTYQGKDIIIAMLSGNYKQQAFPNFGDICALADKIEHTVARCLTCEVRPAPFTIQVSSVHPDDKKNMLCKYTEH